MPKDINGVSLDEVNANLLKRLNILIESADSGELLDITEAVAKLNASQRNNDQFERPETAEERVEREQREVFGQALQEAETV